MTEMAHPHDSRQRAVVTADGRFFRPVRKAYEQVGDQLRLLILTGQLAVGTRLPPEVSLAELFGVSRTTVREALRPLEAQNLVRTTKGPGGGSFVTLPTIDHISESLNASVGLLAESRSLSLEEFLESRELVEVWAARAAALRRTPDDIELLHGLVIDEPLLLKDEERFLANTDFHSVLLKASRNTLLFIAAQPILSVLQPTLFKSSLGLDVYRQVNGDHHRILAAVEDQDADAAEALMREHLAFLRPIYEQAWGGAFGDTDGEVVRLLRGEGAEPSQ